MGKNKINIGQVGCGNWGPNLLRNFYKLQEVNVKYVAEKDKSRVDYVKKNYSDIEVVDGIGPILDDNNIDAVIIATPAELHYSQTKQVLEAGKDCFVEKPLAMKTDKAQELVNMSLSKKKILMVGHTFLYNAAVHKLKEEIQNGNLGEIYYLYSQRLNLGRIRSDINALWNFAPHDISICLYLMDCEPCWVSAIGASYIQNMIEDVVFLTIGFANNVIANIHVSWLDPNKTRKMTVVGSKRMIVYDDVSEYKIKIYDKGIDKLNMNQSLNGYSSFGEFQLIHRAGDLLIPKIDFIEPLSVETKHFTSCVLKKIRPDSDGENGVAVTQIIEAGEKSLSQKGKRVELFK